MAGPNDYVQGAPDSTGKKIDAETRDYSDGLGNRQLQRVKNADDVDERAITLLEHILGEQRKQTALLMILVNDEVHFDDQGNPL